jgi:hypothetical protein
MISKRSPFNSPLETGLRALSILVSAYPRSFDLQSLVNFDYIIVHSGDLGGPASIHAPLPLRTSELVVRREIVDAGLALMMSRALVSRLATQMGIQYVATDSATSFLSTLREGYTLQLRERADWIAANFADMGDEEMRVAMRRLFQDWSIQFQPIERTAGEGA